MSFLDEFGKYCWLNHGFIAYIDYKALSIQIHPKEALTKNSIIKNETDDFLRKYNFDEDALYFLNNYWVDVETFDETLKVLKRFNLESYVDNFCFLLHEFEYSYISKELELEEGNSKNYAKAVVEEYKFGEYIKNFGENKMQLNEIVFRGTKDGKKYDYVVKTRSFKLSIMRAILSYNGQQNWNEYNKSWGDDFAMQEYIPSQMPDFIKYAYLTAMWSELLKIDSGFKKYKIFEIIGRLFSVVRMLDDEKQFNEKNGTQYTYTSYYKYLTDNVRNIYNRCPPLYRDIDKKKKK